MTWICVTCARHRNAEIPIGHLPTMHLGMCDACGQRKIVTAPRDYRRVNGSQPDDVPDRSEADGL